MLLLPLSKRTMYAQMVLSLCSKGPADTRLTGGLDPDKITAKTSFLPYRHQYPLKPEAEARIEQILNEWFKSGVLIECPDSFCNLKNKTRNATV